MEVFIRSDQAPGASPLAVRCSPGTDARSPLAVMGWRPRPRDDGEPSPEAENEDCALAWNDGRRTVLAVADGAGGYRGGAYASRIALDCLVDALERGRGQDDVRSNIVDAFERANVAIRALDLGAGSTLAVAEIDGRRLRTYHAGDSEVLAFGQRGQLLYRTVSHGPTAYAVEAGMLDPSDALHHDDRHLISSALGFEELRIELGRLERLPERSTVVIASDGLTDNLTTDEIVERARRGPLIEVAARLTEGAVARMRGDSSAHPSKPDDLSFAVYRPIGDRATHALALTTPPSPGIDAGGPPSGTGR